MFNKRIANYDVYKIVISLSLIITIVTCSYLRLTNTDGIILNSDLTCNFREEVYINDFITYLDGKLVDNYQVDTNEVGFHDVIITYKNNYGFIVSKKITIEVKDITGPIIEVSNPYVIEKGSINNLEDTILCADDYDDGISCHIKGEYDLDKVGEYSLEISASDKSGNTTSKSFILKVVEPSETNQSNKEIKYTSFKTIYQKYKEEDVYIGVDISKWQKEVDFKELKKQGIDFVMLKIGGQSKIGGELEIDPMFYNNLKEVINNDIQVGIYFYSYAKSEKEALEQADWVIEKLKGKDIDLPIVFDWENWDQYSQFQISFHTLNKVASAFLSRVEEYHYKGMLYASKYYLDLVWYQDDYRNWLAYYNEDFSNYQDYYMWQVCSNGKIEGIDTLVDIDIMKK